MEKLFHDACLVCESTKIKNLKGYESHDLVKCENCGFVFMRRIPTQKELEDHYSTYAYESEKKAPTATKISIESLLEQFEKYRKTNRILDVGCGEGWILEMAKTKGWQVFGTEFSQKAIDICVRKGIKMYPGVLKAENIAERDFDVIVSTETIEHINNPREEIHHFHQLLRQGGLLYITTPNFNSYLRRILKNHYDIIEYPEHLSYYTKRTLDKLLRDSAFYKLKLLTTGISFSRYHRRKIERNTPHPEETNNDELLRERIAKYWMLGQVKVIVNRILTFFGVGMKLKAFYIRE